ncbi:DUF2138 family protein [Ideonella sp. DXS29W]|uniref:DUF2138 family protein n=1 Tax=Ideonella lacteola TaxID=2984193 RepID=A0ABU9BMC0_9BURK
MQKKWAWALGASAVVAIGVGVATFGYARYGGQINAKGVDWRAPAAYLATPSLTGLSRDLIKAPVLRELLTEDFVFYYEAHEDRLGVAGAIKRVAFEHETTFTDDLLALVLDQPAEVALWADDRGAARDWALAMSRNALAKVIQGVGAIAANDKQLSLVAEVPLAAFGLQKVPVYALTVSPRRTLAIASRGNRVVVLSDPGLLFDNERRADPEAAKVLAQLLSGDEGEQGVWHRHFGLGAPGAQHSLVASGPLLALGYHRFMPSLQALRVEVAPGGASLRSWIRQGAGWPASPWAALPAQPAACSVLPVDWTVARTVLGADAGDAASALKQMAESFDGPAAVCWYGQSQLHTPLMVAHAKGPAPSAEVQEAFMRWWLPRGTAWQSGDKAADIAAPYGARKLDDASGYRAAFRRAGDWWLFSPDEALVSRAEDAIARRYPSVADTTAGASPVAVAAPAQMAELFKRETLAVLPREQGGMRQAAETQLLPRLADFGKLPAAQAVPQGKPDAQGWVALDWRPLAANAPASPKSTSPTPGTP